MYNDVELTGVHAIKFKLKANSMITMLPRRAHMKVPADRSFIYSIYWKKAICTLEVYSPRMELEMLEIFTHYILQELEIERKLHRLQIFYIQIRQDL